MWRDDASLLDMIIWARHAVEYTDDVSEDAFRGSRLLQDATIRCIQLIGEAAGRVSDETQDAHPEVEWREIIGIRNRLVHDYEDVALATVWRVARRDCPELIARLEPLVPAAADGLPDEWEFL